VALPPPAHSRGFSGHPEQAQKCTEGARIVSDSRFDTERWPPDARALGKHRPTICASSLLVEFSSSSRSLTRLFRPSRASTEVHRRRSYCIDGRCCYLLSLSDSRFDTERWPPDARALGKHRPTICASSLLVGSISSRFGRCSTRSARPRPLLLLFRSLSILSLLLCITAELATSGSTMRCLRRIKRYSGQGTHI
jgi:hypothetical protein